MTRVHADPPRSVSLTDEAIERALRGLRRDLDPDPLFRRRLRGEVLNRFVASREAMQPARRDTRTMGRLGRAVLYASVALAVSVTGVMAASQSALPGDALYPMKRQIEALRVEVLPPQIHDQLAAAELAQRLTELTRLSERGEWARVAALARTVDADLRAYQREYEAVPDEAMSRRLLVLEALLGGLPPPARTAVERAMDHLERPGGTPAGIPANASPPAAGERPTGGGSADEASQAGSSPPAQTPRPERMEAPKPNPRATMAPSTPPGADRTPRPTPGTQAPVPTKPPKATD